MLAVRNVSSVNDAPAKKSNVANVPDAPIFSPHFPSYPLFLKRMASIQVKAKEELQQVQEEQQQTTEQLLVVLPLREQISNTINIVERYNQFCQWIRFGGGGIMAENDPEEQQKRVRYTDILTNALMLQNVADLTEAVQKLEKRGYPVHPEDVVHLFAYLIEHLQRFGNYMLKLRPVARLSNEQEASSELLSENDGASEEMSA